MSQNSDIRADLEAGKSLTPLSALQDYGTLRLGARIYNLRQKGLPIRTEKIWVRTRDGKARVARYFI